MTSDEFIIKHVTMANRIAAKAAKKRPSERDEILSAAYYGLVKAGRKQSPKNSYVAACIKSEIRVSLTRVLPTSRQDRMFLSEYLSHYGTMEERALKMGVTPEYMFRRLNAITVVVPLQHDKDIPSCQESQLEEMLEVCLRMLPDRLKPAFLLKFRHQYTYDEIAHSNGTSRYTVWAHLKTAIGILRANRERLEGLLY